MAPDIDTDSPLSVREYLDICPHCGGLQDNNDPYLVNMLDGDYYPCECNKKEEA